MEDIRDARIGKGQDLGQLVYEGSEGGFTLHCPFISKGLAGVYMSGLWVSCSSFLST
jgi:hypothetical protein